MTANKVEQQKVSHQHVSITINPPVLWPNVTHWLKFNKKNHAKKNYQIGISTSIVVVVVIKALMVLFNGISSSVLSTSEGFTGARQTDGYSEIEGTSVVNFLFLLYV